MKKLFNFTGAGFLIGWLIFSTLLFIGYWSFTGFPDDWYLVMIAIYTIGVIIVLTQNLFGGRRK